jgi:hypothetical protein
MANAQLGIGLTSGMDFYQFYDKGDPEDVLESSTSGSVLLNSILGPKIWMGAPKFSLSLEAPVNLAIFHFDINEFKGLGAVAFPLAAKLNFGSASGFNDVSLLGFSLGGGIQYMNTEIFGTKKEFKDHIETGFYKTYFGEIGLSFGLAGFDTSLFVRYGKGENEEKSLNVGLVLNMNFTHLKKIMNSEDDEPSMEEVLNEMTFHE